MVELDRINSLLCSVRKPFINFPCSCWSFMRDLVSSCVHLVR